MNGQDDDPDYDELDLDTLLDVERWIDREAYPDRYARLRRAINERRQLQRPTLRSNRKPVSTVSTEPLAVWPVVVRAFVETRRHWRALFKALILPASLIALLPLAVDPTGESRWRAAALAAIYGLVGALYAVSCHRVLLSGESSLPNRYGIYWTRRETRFFGWTIAIAILGALAMTPVALILALAGFIEFEGSLSWLWPYAIYVPAAYVTSRVSMVLPATAVDLRPSIEESWNLTRNNGWRLTVALAIPGLLISMLAYTFNRAIGLPEGVLASTLFALCLWLFGAVEITVLSVAFRFLSSSAESAGRASCLVGSTAD